MDHVPSLHHYDLMRQVNDLSAKCNARTAAMSIEVMMFLKDFPSGHIVGVDKFCTSVLDGKGVR